MVVTEVSLVTQALDSSTANESGEERYTLRIRYRKLETRIDG